MSKAGPLEPIERRGLMLVLSSPSGAGKTTLSRRLLEADQHIEMSISVTTRPPRPGEVDGKDYYFVSPAKFDEMVAGEALLEWAEVFGNRYGTPRGPVELTLSEGRDVLFDIDWQGTQQLHQRAGEDLVRVFILPPSADMLRQRLIKRAQDPVAEVARRMAQASNEISHWAEYDYVLINDDLDRCSDAVSTILHAERLKRTRRIGLSEFVRRLQDKL